VQGLANRISGGSRPKKRSCLRLRACPRAFSGRPRNRCANAFLRSGINTSFIRHGRSRGIFICLHFKKKNSTFGFDPGCPTEKEVFKGSGWGRAIKPRPIDRPLSQTRRQIRPPQTYEGKKKDNPEPNSDGSRGRRSTHEVDTKRTPSFRRFAHNNRNFGGVAAASPLYLCSLRYLFSGDLEQATRFLFKLSIVDWRPLVAGYNPPLSWMQLPAPPESAGGAHAAKRRSLL